MKPLKDTAENRAKIEAISSNTIRIDQSGIAGYGLFAERNIKKGEVIIEYKGILIRSELGNVREKVYGLLNKQQYMFRLNEDWIIDATDAGNEARFINHSCQPNCFTQLFKDGTDPSKDKILIIAEQKIKKNDELCYDYQYEIEDDEHKIRCECGAASCKQWMN